MMTAEFLERLDGVRSRGPGRWLARCASHRDKTPSLSITEGERGILLRCFAGCSVHEIVTALGLKQADLFYAAESDPRQVAQAARLRAQQRRDRERIALADGAAIDALREADRFVRSRRGLDITQWSNERLDLELDALATAYQILSEERAC